MDRAADREADLDNSHGDNRQESCQSPGTPQVVVHPAHTLSLVSGLWKIPPSVYINCGHRLAPVNQLSTMTLAAPVDRPQSTNWSILVETYHREQHDHEHHVGDKKCRDPIVDIPRCQRRKKLHSLQDVPHMAGWLK
jgi:hypothetical protein